MPANKTLRVLCCANNRVTDSSVGKKTNKPKRPSLRSTKTVEPAASTTTMAVIPSKQQDPIVLAVPQPELKRSASSTPDLFRERGFSGALSDELDDMLTLKRATRVYDSEDEYESPTKRLKKMADEEREEFEQNQRPSVLDFRDLVIEDEVEGFQLQDWLQ